MITLVDVKMSLVSLLKEKYPHIPVKSQDFTKGFVRPSFTVIIDEPKIRTGESQIITEAILQIYYFPNLDNESQSLDTLEIQGTLPVHLGNNLAVKDRHIHLDNHDSNVTDGILLHECETYFEQAKETEYNPFITTLETNIGG